MFLFGKIGQNPRKWLVEMELEHEPSQNGFKNSLPIFNNDQLFFTPAFMLAIDKVLLSINSVPDQNEQGHLLTAIHQKD